MPKIIALCGKICCGKTYYANRIKEKEHAVILNCDELTNELFDNDLGEKHDEMALRIWAYLQKKSVDIVHAGSSVILDWDFGQRRTVRLSMLFIMYTTSLVNGITSTLMIFPGRRISPNAMPGPCTEKKPPTIIWMKA